MKILFANRDHSKWIGGDAVQLENTMLELNRLGIDTEYTYKDFHKIADFDLLHVFNLNFRWTYRAVENALRESKPYVISSIFYPKIIDNNKFEMQEMVEGSLATIALSEEEKQEMVDLLEVNPDKIVVIPNGVNKSVFCDGFIPKKRAVTIGRLSPEKGLGQAVMACRELVIPITVVGQDLGTEYSSAIKKMATEWKDNLSPQEIAQELRESSIYICTSTSERQSLSVLEAAACGLNIVDSVHNRGSGLLPSSIVVDPSDSIKLKEAILAQWEKDSRNTDKVPSWADIAKKIAKVYGFTPTSRS
jgi:glycosyltransferase involved in cell wall biosynthesis